jgi:RHS repeat-associated protein
MQCVPDEPSAELVIHALLARVADQQVIFWLREREYPEDCCRRSRFGAQQRKLAGRTCRAVSFRAGVYDPAVGRFLQTEPAGYHDDLNLYTYTLNDPLNNSDPTGTVAVVDDVIIFGGIFLIGACVAYCDDIGKALSDLYYSRRMEDEYSSPMLDEASDTDEVIEDLTEDGEDKGNHEEVDRRGEDQDEDFERIVKATGNNARPINTQYGPGQVVDLPGGGTASTRPGSSTGPGTIQINRPGKIPSKLRY